MNHDPVTKRFMDEIATQATKHDASLTKPGSLAATYAEYEATFARAEAAVGNAAPSGIVTKGSDGTWILSDPNSSDSNTFSTFRYDTAGRIVTFSVNGKPIAGRIARGNDVSGGGVALTNVISYRARDAVYVTFDARNGSDQQLRFGISSIPPGFTLISLSGEQYQSDFENSRGVEVLQSGAASSYAIAFHAPDHGKQLRIELRSESDPLTPIYAATSLHRVS